MATPYQIAERERRKAIVLRTIELRKNKSLAKVAKALKTPLATLNRYLADYRSGGEDALMPDVSSGRTAIAACLGEDAINRLRRQRLKCGSTAMAAQHFIDDPLCPDALADHLIKMKTPHAMPMSLRRAMNVTPEMEAKYRGPVQYGHIAFKCRHNSTVIDPVSDQKRDLMAGDLYLSDDMSRNRYFWFELDDREIETRSNRGDKLARKHGIAIGRQGLLTIDARGKWLGLTLIGCARDSYTSADVLRHMRCIVEEYGKPRIGWVLEKGVWAARTVDGKKVWVPDEERLATVGGLKSLGFMVEHVHTSEGKALIEGAFHHYQKAQSLQEDAPDIGRRRGEMENETRLITRIQAGVLHPAECGLEHISEAVGLDRKTLVWLNGKKKFGRIQHGVPDETWVRDTNRFPLNRLTESDMGIFMPIKIETEIRQGCVEKKIDGRCYRFSCPELFAEIGAGYRLFVTFDDSDPGAGAELYNLETGSRNINGWRHMEYVGHAEWEKERPLFGYSDEVGESMKRRKEHARAFKSAYSGTGIFGKKNMAIAESRDGQGNVQRISKGTPVKKPEPSAPQFAPVEDFSSVSEMFRRRSGIVPTSQAPVEPKIPAVPRIKSRQELLETVS